MALTKPIPIFGKMKGNLEKTLGSWLLNDLSSISCVILGKFLYLPRSLFSYQMGIIITKTCLKGL